MELTLNHITKTFGDFTAVNNVSCTLKPGIIGLLGENGAGKTSLMRMICTITKVDKGEILFNGNNILDLKENYRHLLGYLPQEFGYYPDLTAEQYLMYIASIKALRPIVAKQRIKYLLELVYLYDVRKKKVKKFSGGMKQRLGIAQALLNDPKILILDEPTAGLDPNERVRFRKILRSLSKDRIILLSTHIVSDVEHIADEIIIMNKGKFAQLGNLTTLLESLPIKAWSLSIPPKELGYFQSNFKVTDINDEKEHLNIRLLALKKPNYDATEIECTLEDAFLYYTDDKKVNECYDPSLQN